MSWTWPAALRFESSDVDWCEGNFQITSHIAEFYNTISNILFFVVPPVLIYLFRQYAQQITREVYLVWMLLVIVGAGSAYFHATLSLFGQLLDEIAIIWVIMVAVALWFPKRHMPTFLNESREHFKMLTLWFAVVSTGLACIMPAINALVMIFMGLPCVFLIVSELKSCTTPHVLALGRRCCITWAIALFSWVVDKFACSLTEWIGFPYLHCNWHICVFLASYQACVLMAYFNAVRENSERNPTLTFWPAHDWQLLGIPFVKLRYEEPAKLC